MPRLVAMADTHGQHARLDVPDGDILVHAGDLTGRGTRSELARVAEWLRSLPHRHKVIVAGNHDFAFQRTPEEARALFHGLTYLEDEAVTLEGLRLYGSPWQPYFHNWAFNLRRGPDIDAKWQLIPEGLDVLITHGPPAGYGDLVLRHPVYGEERVGCEDLLRHLGRAKPRFHLCGHIHEDRGQWQVGETRVCNVTVADCELPCTVLDVEPRKD
jgi:Icc-related predicted phosphoesterase